MVVGDGNDDRMFNLKCFLLTTQKSKFLKEIRETH